MQIYYDTAAVYAYKPFIGGPHTGLTGQWTEATTAESPDIFGAPKAPLYCFQFLVIVWLHKFIYIYI